MCHKKTRNIAGVKAKDGLIREIKIREQASKMTYIIRHKNEKTREKNKNLTRLQKKVEKKLQKSTRTRKNMGKLQEK